MIHFNRAEERLARRKRERALGRDFFREIAPCMDVKELAGAFRDGIGRRPLEETIEFSFAFPFLEGPRDVVVHLRSLDVQGVPYATLIIEDVSQHRATERMQQTLSDLLRQDMSSPIAGILAGCGVLIQNAPDLGGEALSTIAEIAQGADQLHSMLTNMIDISRLEGGTMGIVLERASLSTHAHAATATLQGLAAQRGVALEVIAPPEPVEAMFDPSVMARVLDNLLHNALRHAPRGSRVSLRVRRLDAARSAIEVHDEGPMVPEDLRPVLFEKYTRLHEGAPRSDNRGMAMTFVQLAALAHGGEAQLESDPRLGTIFRVVLPAPDPATEFLRIQGIDPSGGA